MTTWNNFVASGGERAEYFKNKFASLRPGEKVSVRWYSWCGGGNVLYTGVEILKIGRRGAVFGPVDFAAFTVRYEFDSYLDDALRDEFGLAPKPHEKSSGMYHKRGKTFIPYKSMVYPGEKVLEP